MSNLHEWSRTLLRACAGYTIIEFDKGVDCNGDTIRLERKKFDCTSGSANDDCANGAPVMKRE